MAPPLIVLTPIVVVRSILNAPRRPIQAVFTPLIFAVLIGAVFKYLPPLVEDILNNDRTPIDDAYYRFAQDCSTKFEVADLHCDSLMWTHRDLLQTTKHPFFKNRSLGAVDLPRLVSGNVQIQVFAVSTEPAFFFILSLSVSGMMSSLLTASPIF